MIRIWNGDIVIVEKKDFNRKEILNKYQAYKSNSRKKFLLQDQGHIMGVADYKDILLKRSIEGNIINCDEEIFKEAFDYFKGIENLYSGCCVAVINKTGNLESILEYYDNSNFSNKDSISFYYQWLYDYEKKYIYDKRMIESLFGISTPVIFDEVNEYTVHLAKILIEERKNGNRNIYFTDKKVFLFLNNTEVMIQSDAQQDIAEMDYIEVVTKAKKDILYKQKDHKRILQILDIMTTLYKDQIEKQLDPHTTKTFIIFNDIFNLSGMVDIMKFSIGSAMIAEKKGYIPIINITDNIVYSDGKGENTWDYYFNPISGYSVDQAYASKNYQIFMRSNKEMIIQSAKEAKQCELQYDLRQQLRELVWKPEIQRYCESEIPKEFYENKRILGVIARGTDYNAPAVIARRGVNNVFNASIEQVIDQTKELLECESYDYIYLATEDYINYCAYKEAFKEQVIVTEQERIDLKKNKQYLEKVVGRIPKEKTPFEYGLDYLVVLQCLARCDSLLSSMFCGAYVEALSLNNGKYHRVVLLRPQ